MKIKKFINLIFLILYTTFFCYFYLGCDTQKDFQKKNAYKGIITPIYRDELKHGMYVSCIKNDSLVFEETIDWYPKSWEYAEIGDSIIKPPDTLMIIIKNNDSTFQEFFYRL